MNYPTGWSRFESAGLQFAGVIARFPLAVDEMREKIFKNYALKSMGALRAKLRQAILYMERNPKLVRSITSFPYIVNSL